MNQQQRAVVQQALEMANAALHEALEHIAKLKEENAALRQLLEQPEQGEVVVKSNGRVSPLLTHMMNSRIRQSNTKQVINLYDRPEQPAAWVGLTDEEIDEADCVQCEYIGMGDYVVDGESVYEFAKAIEAKLREKNGGA
jgi:vacuolar-type H+-ATPase subunit E/Vma4